MRKLVLGLVMFTFAAGTFAQTSAPKYQFKKPGHLGIHFTMHDFATAADIKTNGITNALFVNGQLKNLSNKSAGIAISYSKGLSNHLDVMTRVGASKLSYPMPSRGYAADKYLFEADVNLNIKLIPDNFIVVPYLSVGAGGSLWNGYAAAYMPFGGGIQINVADDCFLHLQTQYRAPITSNNATANLMFGLGITANISK